MFNQVGLVYQFSFIPLSSDNDEEDWKQQRIPQFDGPVDDDLPLPSNQQIPQFDGPVDDDPPLPSNQQIPQFDGPVDDDPLLPSKQHSTAPNRSNEQKITSISKEIKFDDKDDFRVKKKPKISVKRTSEKKDKIVSKEKREVITRWRKPLQLTVLGGNTKKRGRNLTSTIISEVTTKSKRYQPLAGLEIGSNSDTPQSSKSQRNDAKKLNVGKKRNLKNRSSQSLSQDTLQPAARLRRSMSTKKELSADEGNMTRINSGISKTMKDKLLHLEAESSESQTSDFELRLSDSSRDEGDFKKKVRKTSGKADKLDSFDAKPELFTGDQNEISSKNTTSCSQNFTERSEGSEVSASYHKRREGSSENDEDKFENNFKSQKRKRSKSTKTTCLVFPHVNNQTKSEIETSTKPVIASFPNKSCDKLKIRSKISITSGDETSEVNERSRKKRNAEKMKSNEGTIRKKSKNRREITNKSNISRNSGRKTKKENKKGKHTKKLLENRILLDACIKLEKISVKELKSMNNCGRQVAVDFPIKFVGEEESMRITSWGDSEENDEKKLTSIVDNKLPSDIKIIQKQEAEVFSDVSMVDTRISAMFNSFSIDEEQSSLEVEELLKGIESPLLERQKIPGETNVDVDIIKNTASPCPSKDKQSLDEAHDKFYLDSEKINLTSSLHDVRHEDNISKFNDENSFKDIETEQYHEILETTVHVNDDSKNNELMIESSHTVEKIEHITVKLLDKQSVINKHHAPHLTEIIDSDPTGHFKILKPTKEAPSRSYVLETRRLYGLPHKRHQKAFFSDPKDAPVVTRLDKFNYLIFLFSFY